MELVTRDALARAVAGMTMPAEREHVTPYLYAHPDRFRIRSFTAAVARPDVQLSVDTLADFDRCEAVLRTLGAPAWQAGWEACVRASDGLAGRALGGRA